MHSEDDLSSDSDRPAKRQRVDTPPRTIPPTTAEDDIDDASLYGTPSKPELLTMGEPQAARQDDAEKVEKEDKAMEEHEKAPQASTAESAPALPGLGLSQETSKDIYYEPPTPQQTTETDSSDIPESRDTPLLVHNGDDIMIDAAETVLPTIENSTAEAIPGTVAPASAPSNEVTAAQTEFIEAAKAAKGDPGAEWEYDSSDEETSSSSSSDSSDSDEDYELLDPVTQARILMADGSDDEGPSNKSTRDHQPRTQNEIADEPVERPDITVTPSMRVTELGRVEKAVDQLVLIEADSSGDYKVLEQGSVLCLEDRKVIGVIAETLGRVQKPLYTVRFNNAAEITEHGVFVGTKIYYVEDHSTYVFTQALRQMKGTDASNIHDEEVGDHEREFSDDEAEAAWKREQKLARQNKAHGGKGAQGRPERNQNQNSSRGNRNFSDRRGGGARADGPSSQSQTSLQYDEPGTEDFYTPLARPQNFEHMMNASAPQRSTSVQMTDYTRGQSRSIPPESASVLPPRPPATGAYAQPPAQPQWQPPAPPSLPQLTPEQQQWAQIAILQQMQAAAAAGSSSPFTPPPPPLPFLQQGAQHPFIPPPPPGFSSQNQSPYPQAPQAASHFAPYSNPSSMPPGTGQGGYSQQATPGSSTAPPDPDAAFRAAQAQLEILRNLSKR